MPKRFRLADAAKRSAGGVAGAADVASERWAPPIHAGFATTYNPLTHSRRDVLVEKAPGTVSIRTEERKSVGQDPVGNYRSSAEVLLFQP